jgi:hypothetical protein
VRRTTIDHSEGEGEKFYRELKQRGVSVRVGDEVAGYTRWLERLLAGRGFKVRIGDAAEIKKMRVRMLWGRHRLVRTRIMNQLQAVAMNEGQRWKKKLFSNETETGKLGCPR